VAWPTPKHYLLYPAETLETIMPSTGLLTPSSLTTQFQWLAVDNGRTFKCEQSRDVLKLQISGIFIVY